MGWPSCKSMSRAGTERRYNRSSRRAMAGTRRDVNLFRIRLGARRRPIGRSRARPRATAASRKAEAVLAPNQNMENNPMHSSLGGLQPSAGAGRSDEDLFLGTLVLVRSERALTLRALGTQASKSRWSLVGGRRGGIQRACARHRQCGGDRFDQWPDAGDAQ